ncbi:MAG: UDP-N-acetylmuramate dehydrogenase [Desulfobulbaceae bacterium]|nr:UDP-N-acetylmuramate dehydrogenase [Desulfobulbaceae bacterium]
MDAMKNRYREQPKSMTAEQRHALAGFWKGSVNWDVSMRDYCTLQAGGSTDALVVASTLAELEKLVRWLQDHEIAWRVIGRGSNILITGKGFHGVLIILGEEFSSIGCRETAADGKTRVAAGAGCSVSRLVGWCGRHSLSGLEFMSGIPGSVGGAVYMNAGAWGSEIGEYIAGVSFVDVQGCFHEVPAEEIDFSYRRIQPGSEQLQHGVIVGAEFLLLPGRQREIFEKCRLYQEQRRKKQPVGMPSAGSFFKNPEGDSAGRLIEAAGLKGLRRGNAMVSPVHANFIVNTGQATADEIIALMQEVQERVFHASGILLEPEVQLL